MKKTLLAMVVAATAAGSVNAAELLKTDTASLDFYGQLREQIVQGSEDSDPTVTSGSSRTGLNARYVANDSVTVIGTYEIGIADFSASESGSWAVRKHYIGLDFGDAGTVTLGKQSILSDDVWGAENSYFGDAKSMLPESGVSMNWLQRAMLKYTVEGEAGWLQAAYSYDNEDADQTTAELYVGRSFGAVSVYGGVGYLKDQIASTNDNGTYDDSDDFTVHNDDEMKHAMLTVAYDADAWNVGATYWYKDSDSSGTNLKTNSMVVAGSVKVADKTSVYGGYEFITDFESENNDYQNVYAGVEYKYASWARVFAEFGSHTQDVADGDDSYWGVGARLYW